jgi:hypothetical protein
VTTLTLEQRQALDRLFGPAELENHTGLTDLLTGFLGLPPDALRARLGTLLADKQALERQILAWAEANPLEAAFELLAGASLAFYLVEKGANPKISTYVDAFYYIATCASVGYADIFAVTQPGRAIAALVMTVGPSLAARIFDRGQSLTRKDFLK